MLKKATPLYKANKEEKILATSEVISNDTIPKSV